MALKHNKEIRVMNKLTSKEYKERLLSIILKIDKICRENDIRYTIIYGTLLGSIRHKGFIPWDDDMDIAMSRKDFYKLGQYISKHPELELNFIDISNRADTIYVCGKVCDTKTIIHESIFKPIKGLGAFIDVFPLDNIPNNEKERKRFKSRARYLARLIQHSAQLNPGKPKSLKHAVLLYGSFLYAKCFNTNKLITKLNDYCNLYNSTETEYCGVPYFISYFRKNDFNELIDLPFEGYMLKGPKNFESVLNASYKDYKSLPPPDKRINHLIECYWRE